MAYRILLTEYFVTIIADSNDSSFLSLVDTFHNVYATRKHNTYCCSLHMLPEILAHGRNIHGPEQIYDGLARRLYMEEMARRTSTQQIIDNGPTSVSDFLWRHQLLGVDLAAVNRRYGFFYDTRTGKTLMAYQIMQNALVTEAVKRCVVVCPSAIIESWLADAEKFFPNLKVNGYYGSDKQKREALNKPAHIILWSMEQAVANMDILYAAKPGMVFIDESSKLKSHKSQISKAMLDYSATVPSWYLLSATPAPNNQSEYYTQMRTIDAYCFNPARGHFVNRYFNDSSRDRNIERLSIKPEMETEFMNVVKERAIYVDQSVMPTTESKWMTAWYDMPDSTRNIYNNMVNDMYMSIAGSEIVVKTQALMRAKLDQITKGFIMDTTAIKTNKSERSLGYDSDLEEVHRIDGDTSRIDCLANLLRMCHGEKIVIWANYRYEFDMIKELLGDKAHYIHGGFNVEDKMQFIDDFRAGSVQYLVCHPLSVGMGINLTAAHIAIYYSINDSWEALKQSSERIRGHVSVQTKDCLYFVIQARDTINTMIYNNVTNKRDASWGFMSYLQAEALK